MKTKLPVLLALLAASTLTGAASDALLQAMQNALHFRVELATTVARHPESTAGALERLRAREDASGLALTGPADFAPAALDVGRRLLSAGRTDAAEVFFRAAEQAFDQAANRTPNLAVQEKAQYLQKLSAIRGHYLNKMAQAKADIDQAIALQPEDQTLREARAALARGKAESFKDETQTLQEKKRS